MRRQTNASQEAMYQMEHWLAWLFLIGAIVLGSLGVLRGFDIIGGTTASALSEGKGAFWDGMLLIIPGICAAFLAMALHQSDHHRVYNPEGGRSREGALFMAEHGLGWLALIGTVALEVLGMIIGLKVFGGSYDQSDGLLWAVPGLGAAILTATLHTARQHQLETEEDYIVRIVEERVAPGRATGRMRAPGSESAPPMP